MKISVVTISFNQARYLRACIASVAQQGGDWEHIIVDPGSTDGSREIIEANRHCFAQFVLEPDRGPADGLNKGFERATGDVVYYLNADDIILPDTFDEARAFLTERPWIDVVSGHGYVIDESGQSKRPLWSDQVSRLGLAHGGSILIQPATFIRKSAFDRTKGFNPENRSNWDSELVLDLFLSGSRFAICERHWAGYRIHDQSITGTAKLDDRIRDWSRRKYELLMGRPIGWDTSALTQFFRLKRALRRPEAIIARLAGERVYGGRKK